MNKRDYTALKNKYEYRVGGWGELLRTYAFMEFDAALEEYGENGWAENNDGDELFDVSPADVEAILDEFGARWDERIAHIATDEMRNAIQAVTGLVC